MILSLLGLAGGIGMPMQTSINTQLGKKAGSPFFAAMINFMVGISALLIITILVEGGLGIPFGAIARAPVWVCFGGVLAVLFIMANILIMPRLGSVQTAILPALGQIIMGTLIDTFGWFGSIQRPLGPIRLIGIAMVFFGVILIIHGKESSSGTSRASCASGTKGSKGSDPAAPGPAVRNIWFWRGFGLIGGMSMAAQTAINSHLSVVVDSRLFASVINFSVGLSLRILLNILLIRSKKPWDKKEKAPLWIWSGGLFGVLFVIGNIIAARTVGTGMAVILLLTGLMIGGLLVDHFGLFRSQVRPVSVVSILGVLIMVLGAVAFYLF